MAENGEPENDVVGVRLGVVSQPYVMYASKGGTRNNDCDEDAAKAKFSGRMRTGEASTPED